MIIELIMTKEENEDLYNHLNTSSLADSSAFPIDLGEEEYIALPREVVKLGEKLRITAIVVECD